MNSCLEYDDGLTVCFSNAREIRRFPDDRETRWCFNCRKHLRHECVVYAEPFPSYYDPTVATECIGCHGEDIYFPGCGPL